MAKLLSRLRWTARAFVRRGIVGLFLVQAMALAFAASGRAEFAHSDADLSLAVAGEICRSDVHDGGTTPTRKDGRHHCDMCPAARDGSPQNVVAAPPRRIDIATPGTRTQAFPRLATGPSPIASGWTSSWSSRAPPARA